jgi:hypothetical protein
MSRVDLQREPDLDTVAQIAYELAERLREEDLRELHEHLVDLCRHHPAKAAQIIACLAAWLDPETPTGVLWERVESITDLRLKAAMA